MENRADENSRETSKCPRQLGVVCGRIKRQKKENGHTHFKTYAHDAQRDIKTQILEESVEWMKAISSGKIQMLL